MGKLLQHIRSRTLKDMLRELAFLNQYSRQYKKEILWYLFVGLLGTGVSLMGSILSKYIIDAVTGFDTRGIVAALVFFVLMQLSQILFNAITSRINMKVSIRVNQQITAQVYDLNHFPEIRDRYNVMSVPCLLVNDGETVSFGKKNIRQLLELLKK